MASRTRASFFLPCLSTIVILICFHSHTQYAGGRKYEVDRAAKLLPQLLQLKEDYALEATDADNAQLIADLNSHKMMPLGSKDDGKRSLVWVRIRYHDPKKSKPHDMARMIATNMLHVMKDVDAQRYGLVIVNDMTGLGLKNLDPGMAKKLFGEVFPRLPIRIGKICIFNPPWIVGHVILPLVMTFMSKKLKSRITIINGSKTEKLHAIVPPASLPKDLGGTLEFDEDKFAEMMIAGLPKPVVS